VGWGAAPPPGQWLHIDIDATITIDYSDNKEGAAATWKKTWGHHSLLAFLDRPEIADGEALAGLLRPGNAGSNTAADHITVLGWALSRAEDYRPTPTTPARNRFWCAIGRRHPRFAETPRAGVGSPSATPWMPACRMRWKSSTPPTAGIRRSGRRRHP
jgi:hypothetical protein